MKAKQKKSPSPRVLCKLIDYNPQTGEMRWKERPVWMFRPNRYSRKSSANYWNLQFAGKPALAANDRGYLAGEIFTQWQAAHRVAWAIHYGEWPSGHIDHINQQRDDNRISNLRDVTQAENSRNKRMHANNKSGVIGVSWYPRSKKWAVDIGVGGKRNRLGYFTSIEEATEVRKAAERKLGFHANHGSDV
jgi:hypothetical protein